MGGEDATLLPLHLRFERAFFCGLRARLDPRLYMRITGQHDFDDVQPGGRVGFLTEGARRPVDSLAQGFVAVLVGAHSEEQFLLSEA